MNLLDLAALTEFARKIASGLLKIIYNDLLLENYKKFYSILIYIFAYSEIMFI